ncbi:MAG: C69 family dipeptidase [Anaerolineae bacterium]|nr:C69 family dipeptidase [Anaerolineae bacterium]MDW8067508.1 C69 family dipeptidase [Anaerolineae bacterium]
MCDTLVATGCATADGTVILAKNSDREPNEAHVLVHLPRTRHQPGSRVKCTYIELPQVAETYEVLLCKPFWIWGCEMGVNEHGVAIGNEAVFTREPYHRAPGLIGMDFIRLALERADTARRALETIIQLLETYGQGGNCGFRHKTYYHNSYIIADPQEAWVLETVGKRWAAEWVRDVRAISNGLTIGTEWDEASPDLVEYARKRGWCRSREDFHFARCYSDFLYTRLDGCRVRHRRSTELLESQKGRITVQTMMAALRDHGPEAESDPHWNPGRGWQMETLCVHAGWGPTRPSQSVGAMVAHLIPGMPIVWVTGTSAPCTGLFKPIFLGGAGLPSMPGLEREPTGTYDPGTLWWNHERLHRQVIRDYATRLPVYREERDALETTFLEEAAEMGARYRQANPGERAEPLRAFTASCFERAASATERWIEKVAATPVRQRPPFLFSLAWNRWNREADFPL